MIDQNKDYVIKSKLTLTVKRLRKNNYRNKVADKQTNRLTDTETDKI